MQRRLAGKDVKMHIRFSKRNQYLPRRFTAPILHRLQIVAQNGVDKQGPPTLETGIIIVFRPNEAFLEHVKPLISNDCRKTVQECTAQSTEPSPHHRSATVHLSEYPALDQSSENASHLQLVTHHWLAENFVVALAAGKLTITGSQQIRIDRNMRERLRMRPLAHDHCNWLPGKQCRSQLHPAPPPASPRLQTACFSGIRVGRDRRQHKHGGTPLDIGWNGGHSPAQPSSQLPLLMTVVCTFARRRRLWHGSIIQPD
mmetsp:Transcript_26999/g.69878  ORF Transcript_26999/g.69878 Transcript_26999/m.69878 type:complete len:257 (+) Transcript_26999:1074-1844(+)